MAKRNYSKMSQKPEVEQTDVSECELEVVENEAAPEIVEEIVPVVGIVVGCGKLNIRKEPSVEAEILCEASVGSELMIDESASTKIWVKVCTAAGSEGFCMRKFVEIQ